LTNPNFQNRSKISETRIEMNDFQSIFQQSFQSVKIFDFPSRANNVQFLNGTVCVLTETCAHFYVPMHSPMQTHRTSWVSISRIEKPKPKKGSEDQEALSGDGVTVRKVLWLFNYLNHDFYVLLLSNNLMIFLKTNFKIPDYEKELTNESPQKSCKLTVNGFEILENILQENLSEDIFQIDFQNNYLFTLTNSEIIIWTRSNSNGNSSSSTSTAINSGFQFQKLKVLPIGFPGSSCHYFLGNHETHVSGNTTSCFSFLSFFSSEHLEFTQWTPSSANLITLQKSFQELSFPRGVHPLKVEWIDSENLFVFYENLIIQLFGFPSIIPNNKTNQPPQQLQTLFFTQPQISSIMSFQENSLFLVSAKNSIEQWRLVKSNSNSHHSFQWNFLKELPCPYENPLGITVDDHQLMMFISSVISPALESKREAQINYNLTRPNTGLACVPLSEANWLDDPNQGIHQILETLIHNAIHHPHRKTFETIPFLVLEVTESFRYKIRKEPIKPLDPTVKKAYLFEKDNVQLGMKKRNQKVIYLEEDDEDEDENEKEDDDDDLDEMEVDTGKRGKPKNRGVFEEDSDSEASGMGNNLTKAGGALEEDSNEKETTFAWSVLYQKLKDQLTINPAFTGNVVIHKFVDASLSYIQKRFLNDRIDNDEELELTDEEKSSLLFSDSESEFSLTVFSLSRIFRFLTFLHYK
jgi:hypothetical protein